MKFTRISRSTLKLSSILSVSFSLSSAQAYMPHLADDSNAKCVRSEREIQTDPEMSALIESFGGLQNIEGKFKLTGLAGEFAKVKFKFASTPSGFYVQPEQDPIEEVHLCHQAAKPGVLRIRVLTPALPENGLFLVRPAKPGELLIAAKGSKWKFMKFKRMVKAATAE